MTKTGIPPQIKSVIDSMVDAVINDNLAQIYSHAVFPSVNSPMSAWTANNRLIAAFTNAHARKIDLTDMNDFLKFFAEMDYRGFKQWQKVDRHVLVGEKAGYILVPMFIKTKKYKIEKKQADGSWKFFGDSFWKPYDSKKHPENYRFEESEVPMINGFKTNPVFDIKQTAGKPVNHTKLKLPQLPFKPVSDFLELKIIPASFNGQEYGSFNPSRGIIQLNSPAEFVFLHELSHAVDNYLMIKKTGHGLKLGQDIQQETIAEFCAAVLTVIIDPKAKKVSAGLAAKYIESYAPDKRGEALMKVLGRVENVITFISNFKEAKSPVREMEEKTGEPKDKAEIAADNPKKELVQEPRKKLPPQLPESLKNFHPIREGNKADKITKYSARKGKLIHKNLSKSDALHYASIGGWKVSGFDRQRPKKPHGRKTAYNLFVQKHMKDGKSMSETAALWKQKKVRD